MYPFKKILVPVDYSEACGKLVPWVIDMQKRFSAQLTLVHAYGPGAILYRDLPAQSDNLIEEAREVEDHRLAEFVSENFAAEKPDAIAQLGDPAEVVRKAVVHHGADLVMLPTHGKGMLRRFLLGSVTAKLLHDVDCPVWTATSAVLERAARGISYKSILCAVDDTDDSEAVMRAAQAFSSTVGADWSLVHVVPTPAAPMDVDLSPYLRAVIDAADLRLRERKERLGIDVPHAVLSGGTTDDICREALQRNADLLVVGRGSVQTRLSGMWSHLYQIVREAPCPVLSI